MYLELTDDQRLFAETTVRFIESELPITKARDLHDDPAGYEEKWLRRAADLGWFAMLVPEDLGGGSVSGHGVLDAALVAEAQGRYVQPGPFIPMNVAADTLATHGTPEQQALLTGLVTGETVITWAPFAVDGTWDAGAGVSAAAAGDSWVLDGGRGFVQDAQTAQRIVVAATLDGQPAQFVVASSDISIRPLSALDLTRRMGEITLSRAPAQLVAGASLDRQLAVAVALSCAETVGALDAMFTMTVEYAKDRIAFGRPIGSFQAIKHVLADLGLWLEACKAMAVDVARAVEEGRDDVDTTVSIAASFIGEHATEIAQQCLQVHGGIGYTWEHDLHLLMRRTRTNSALYGTPTWHRERLCSLYELGETR